jgi:hypothetical protein
MERVDGTQVMRDKYETWSVTYMCIVVRKELAMLADAVRSGN